MPEHALTQASLMLVYLTVAGMMELVQRVEKSPGLRLWTLTLWCLAANAGVGALRSAYPLPFIAEAASLLALAAACMTGLLGALKFIGRALPWGVYLLGGVLAFTAVAALVWDVGRTVLRPVVFGGGGIALFWAALLAVRSGVPGGAGRWAGGFAFAAGGAYAFVWPLVGHLPLMGRLEFVLDLTTMMLGVIGVLLMHFDRAREQVRELAAHELELREKLERAERLDALGRLAGGVAHDINNVLTIVINGAELVLRQLGDRPRAASQLRMVLEAAEGAVGFTRQLLALGRRRMPGRKPHELNAAVRTALQMVRPSLPANVDLVCELSEREPTVKSAEGQLEQLIINLALNAAAAMPHGGTLEVRTELAPGEKGLVRLLVRDTGTGMDPATLSHIFEPFFTTKTEQGTGLGLATVYAIVQQLEGEISVQSTLGSGTLFSIELPVKEAGPMIAAPAEAGKSSADGPAQRRRSQVQVLVVDDRRQVLDCVVAGLQAAGFRVRGCSDAEQAIASAGREPPHVLLTDVCMPGVRGPELARRLRARNPALGVILMTGHASEAESDRAGTVWLPKPFSLAKLIRSIDTVAGNQRPAES